MSRDGERTSAGGAGCRSAYGERWRGLFRSLPSAQAAPSAPFSLPAPRAPAEPPRAGRGTSGPTSRAPAPAACPWASWSAAHLLQQAAAGGACGPAGARPVCSTPNTRHGCPDSPTHARSAAGCSGGPAAPGIVCSAGPAGAGLPSPLLGATTVSPACAAPCGTRDGGVWAARAGVGSAAAGALAPLTPPAPAAPAWAGPPCSLAGAVAGSVAAGAAGAGRLAHARTLPADDACTCTARRVGFCSCRNATCCRGSARLSVLRGALHLKGNNV